MRRSASSWAWLLWLPFVAVAFGPVLQLLGDSLSPGDEGFTLRAYREVLLDARKLELLWHSLEVGLGVCVVTLLVGLPYGFLISRTNLRGRQAYGALVVVPLLLPPYITGIAWEQVILLGGYDAILLTLASGYFPIVALLAARGFREVGQETEDAARLVLSPTQAVWRVTLPLARPALLAAALLVFVLAVSDFSVPDFFSFAGQREGSYQVFATDVYYRWATLVDAEGATAAALPLVLVATLCMVMVARLEGRRSHASVRGTYRPPRAFRLGCWQLPAHLFLALVLVISAGIPIGVLARWSLAGERPVAGAPALPASVDPQAPVSPGPPPPELASTSGGSLRKLLRGPAGGDLLRSLGYCSGAALLVGALALGPAWILSRRGKTRPGALALVLLPLGFPSLLIGMSQLSTFHRPWAWMQAFYGGGGLVVLTLAARYVPLAVLGLRASWLRIDPEIEEAAQLAIPSPRRRFLRVTLPLLAPGLVATLILCFGLAMRDLDTIVLLDGAQRTLPLRIYNKAHYGRDMEVGMLCLLQLAATFVPWTLVLLLRPRSPGSG